MRITPLVILPHKWWSGSELKTGRREVPGSISGLACRPSCLEFSVVFFKTRVNADWNPLERHYGGLSHYSPRSLVLQMDLNLQPINRLTFGHTSLCTVLVLAFNLVTSDHVLKLEISSTNQSITTSWTGISSPFVFKPTSWEHLSVLT